jgi:uncharacterized membrane protein YfcA
LTFALLVLAGVAAGLTGSIAGIASLVSYPALLASGLAPVAANVTNTVALVFQSLGTTHGSLPELRGQGPLVRRLILPALLGGATGGVLLLLTPSDAFAKIVPWLIGGAAVAILIRPRPKQHEDGQQGRSAWLRAGVFVTAIYGGYFGAAAGVVMMALLLLFTGDTLPRGGALRTVLLGAANTVAAIYFIVSGPVHWSAVIPLALGLLVGGRIGPEVVRRTPAGALRFVIALCGLGLAVKLALDAY